ncbi:MAG: single-stranded-DNA-specific exonuclease RecJ [Schwartzia sp.]|nr:single-stranded-DNA-specific exonuclease RecJ [Schwartzia sp. (in: firmicutes)]
MRKKWSIVGKPDASDQALGKELGVSTLLAGILRRRGITNAQEAKAFLSPETEQPYYDPFGMKDMDRAVARIRRAIGSSEKIVVYGDYDVDGITSTTLLVRALRRLGAAVEYYIPDRQEGYGLHTESLEKLAANGARLVVTVDCGIANAAEIGAVRDKLDIVVTDHHLPGEQLPDAEAVVDPHREDCEYPFKDLAGVGVAFKLCQALFLEMKGKEFQDDLEVVALGTIADIVPLLSENRKLVKLGLVEMKGTKIEGLRQLIEVSGLSGKEITSGQVGFVLAPRLNAAGRLETAMRGVELLLTEEESRAKDIALALNELNSERQQVEADILEQAKKQLASVDTVAARTLVIAGQDWHPGVIGIVASRLVELYYRPTVIVSIQDGVGKGSCRSIRGFHLFDALTAAKDTLVQFGGHEMAAGLTVMPGNLDALRQVLDEYADAHLTAEDYIPCLELEAELRPEEITKDLVTELSRLEPYGMANPRPVFGCFNVRGSDAKVIGREGQHLKFMIRNGADSLEIVGWNMSEKLVMLHRGRVDLAFVPELNEWNGRVYVQCKLTELRHSEGRHLFPTREILGGIYLALKKERTGQAFFADDGTLADICDVSPEVMGISLRIFEELGLVLRDGERLRLVPPPKRKLDLEDSPTFRNGAGTMANTREA